MKGTTLTLLFTSAVILGAGLYNQFNSTKGAQIDIPNVASLFNEWKNRQGKNYISSEEVNYRLSVFHKNYLKVITHNSQNLGSTLALNKFADLTAEEFKIKFTGLQSGGQPDCDAGAFDNINVNQLPDSVDWVAKGAVTRVKNQGQCGSCWAFATTGGLESWHYLQGNPLIEFSEQQLNDCTTVPPYNNAGCNGGFISTTYWYIRDHGIELESTYPYTARDQSCRASGTPALKVAGCNDIPFMDNDALKAAVAQQPVPIAIDAGQLQLYSSGIISHNCGQQLDHGVLIVGYGNGHSSLHPHEDFWKIKNSWGRSWGEQGYFRVKRVSGVKETQCGLNMAAVVPK